MEVTERGKVTKAVCLALALGAVTACGGGGGTSGSGSVDQSKYTGLTTKASITTSNAVAFTSDAFAAGSIGSSANVVGVMVENGSGSGGKTTTLPEIAAAAREGVAQAMAGKWGVSSLTGVAATTTVYGASGGSAAVSMEVNDTTGSFTGTMTFTGYRGTADGPTLSGTVHMSGIYSQTAGKFGSLSMTCAPLSATGATGSESIYGTFAYSATSDGETLAMSCTVNVNTGQNYWIKDWTYTFSADTLTITGVYYHPSYGYVEITTPTALKASALYGTPTAGVFQAAGAHCSKARLTFSATGSTVTAIGGDNQNWQLCGE